MNLKKSLFFAIGLILVSAQTWAAPSDQQLPPPDDLSDSTPNVVANVRPSPRPSSNAVIPKAPPPKPLKHFGLTLSVNIPHPIFAEIEARLNRHWSFALGGGGLPLSINDNGTPLTFGIFGIDARARWHPFGGSFFLGMAGGYQFAYGSASQNFTVDSITLPVTYQLNIDCLYVTPHLGWLIVFGSGFTLGFELGVQVPFHVKSNDTITSTDSQLSSVIGDLQSLPAYQNLNANVEDAADKYGKISLPYVTLLKLGWMF